MPTMLSEVYDAFRKAGTPDEDARKAAEALSQERDRTSSLENSLREQIGDLRTTIEKRFADVDKRFADVDLRIAVLTTELRAIKWFGGVMLVAILGGIIRLLMT